MRGFGDGSNRSSGQSYDRDPGEVPPVQEETACAIAAEVRADLTPREQMPFRAAAQVRPEAYDCYLRGRFYAHRQNKDDNDTAMGALERAVAIDPTFAMAYAELAQTYIWKLFLFAPHERQWEEKAFMAVEKALSLDPDLAVAEDGGALFISMQAVFAAAAGEESRAKNKIRVAIKTGKGFGHFTTRLITWRFAFALMKQREQAVKWLDAAATDGFPCYPLFESDANLENLRGQAPFTEFMVGLRHQWTDYRDMVLK